MKTFNLPDLGEGLPDAEIREWHIKEGDEVKVDQFMVSMETAKAVVEVPAPRSGKILKLHGKPGDVIQTGKPLVEFEDGDEQAVKPKDSGTVAGSIVVGDTILDESPMGITPKTATAGIKAIPAVRALAKRLNVDLTKITPTGTNGQITAADVEQAANQPPAMAEGFEPLRGVRRTMAMGMAQSHMEVVPVTLMDDADIQAWPQETDITIRVIRAIIAGCKAEPSLNAWYDTKSMSRRLFDKVNLGLAVDSAEGLFVPVLKDADSRSAKELRTEINTFKEQISSRKIPQEALRDSTIVLSNFGTFAGRYANPIIIPPTVAILGTGRVREEIVAKNGAPAVHRIMPLSLTIDHRAITGGEATRFLAAVIKDLESAK